MNTFTGVEHYTTETFRCTLVQLVLRITLHQHTPIWAVEAVLGSRIVLAFQYTVTAAVFLVSPLNAPTPHPSHYAVLIISGASDKLLGGFANATPYCVIFFRNAFTVMKK